MPSTYSNLKIQLMATGENNTTWGNVTNVNLGTALEEAITGSVDVTFASGDVTLTLTNTNATQSARNLRLNCTGTTGGARNLILGSGCQIEKVYIVNNGCADAITVKNTTGSGIAVPAGKTMYVFNNGTDVVDAITHLSSLTLASALPIASGGTGSTTATFSGANITALNASNISSGTIANARTTASSTNGASTIVTRDASGNFSANTITASLNGNASSATNVSGTVAIANGGTGSSTATFSGANITSINASNISSGTVATARLASGTANSTTFLRGDQTWNSPATYTISNKTSLYTVVAGDLGTIINCTSGNFTVSLTAAASLGSGFSCWIWNSSSTSTDVITIDPNGSETIDGSANRKLYRGEGVQIVCDGTNWQTAAEKALRGYAENLSPTDTKAVAQGAGAIGIGIGSNGFGTESIAIGTATLSQGSYSFAGGYGALANANYAVAIGSTSAGLGASAQGAGAVALGGSYASGANSFAAANESVSGTYGALGANSVAIGYRAKAVSTSGLSLGGEATTNFNYSFAVGYACVADAPYAFALGGYSKSSIRGKLAYTGDTHGWGTGAGQTGTIVLAKTTTNATPTVLTSSAQAASSDNQVILPDDSTFTFSILVVARRTDADNESAGYKFEGVVDRNSGAATTAIVGTVTKTVLAEDTAAWDANVTADTTNGGLKVEVTGETSKTIRWVATCWTSEVTG